MFESFWLDNFYTWLIHLYGKENWEVLFKDGRDMLANLSLGTMLTFYPANDHLKKN